jgi:hypothetical protein
MALFNFLKKDKANMVDLPLPDDSISFFEKIKLLSERYWKETTPNKNLYGFQIQQNSKWKNGLSEHELAEFEKTMSFNFPLPLRNFYKTMNGLTKPGINIGGNDGSIPVFSPVFYSFPDDLAVIKESIELVCEENSIRIADLGMLTRSRIFPIFLHRFMLVDEPGNPILSMYGTDKIYWAENISKLLANEIFDDISNVSDFETNQRTTLNIKFWLD